MVAAVSPEVMRNIVAAIPAGRLSTSQDIARVAAFLAAEDSSFVTGATFDINGGQYLG